MSFKLEHNELDYSEEEILEIVEVLEENIYENIFFMNINDYEIPWIDIN